ncbi:MAG: glycosyltransferase family 4 protein [Promethearchaeota archaeon]
MKVLVFSPIAVENGRGGEISSMELAEGLHRFYKVTFIDTNRLMGKPLLSKEAIKKKLKNVNISARIKFATLNVLNRNFDFPYIWEIIKLYKIVKKHDIIYSSFTSFKVNLIFMILSLLHRRGKFIIGYRKPLYSEKIFSLYNLKYRISILFFSLFKKRIYHHALSFHAKKYLENFYNSEKITHIIHGIGLENFKVNGIKKKSDNSLKFIYVGQLENIHKGFGELIKGIQEFIENNRDLNVHFDICGVGPLESEVKKLEKLYPNSIKYYGYVSNDLLPEIYMKNDIFIFSSKRDPFPRVIMEALASNLIILCTKTIGSNELLKGKDFAFFLEELSPNTIKIRIKELYQLWQQNLEKFRSLQKSAKEYVFKYYSFERELEMFKDLIDRICKV